MKKSISTIIIVCILNSCQSNYKIVLHGDVVRDQSSVSVLLNSNNFKYYRVEAESDHIKGFSSNIGFDDVFLGILTLGIYPAIKSGIKSAAADKEYFTPTQQALDRMYEKVAKDGKSRYVKDYSFRLEESNMKGVYSKKIICSGYVVEFLDQDEGKTNNVKRNTINRQDLLDL